jgi:hypothetical protein
LGLFGDAYRVLSFYLATPARRGYFLSVLICTKSPVPKGSFGGFFWRAESLREAGLWGEVRLKRRA